MDRTVQLKVQILATAWDDSDGDPPIHYTIDLGDSVLYQRLRIQDSIAKYEDARKIHAELMVREMFKAVERFFDDFPLKELADGWHRA